MNELIEDYQRKINTINELLKDSSNSDDTINRLKIKVGCYRSFLTDLNRALNIDIVSESNLTMHQLNCKTWMVKNEMGDILTEGTKQECDDFVRGWLEAERSGI